jgi:hypothetical protein
VAAITGGVFELRVGLRRIRGIVLEEGSGIRNNGDNTFGIRAVLLITSGGAGILIHEGELNHNVFPPTEIGGVR